LIEDDPLLQRGDATARRWQHTTRVTTGLSDARQSLKYGTSAEHTVFTDERPGFGGEGTAPTPLGYFALAAGWCVLSQLLRYARIRRVVIDDATCEVEVDWSLGGSARDGDINAACEQVRYRMVIESPNPQEEVEEVIALARQGCFVEQALQNATPTGMEVEIRSPDVSDTEISRHPLEQQDVTDGEQTELDNDC
jgi:uncharacterized OsmC-like protein